MCIRTTLVAHIESEREREKDSDGMRIVLLSCRDIINVEGDINVGQRDMFEMLMCRIGGKI